MSSDGRYDAMEDTIIDLISCILAERDKMMQCMPFTMLPEDEAIETKRTRDETASLIYRLIMESSLQGNQYVHLHMSDAVNALKNEWPVLLYNAARSIATSPFTTPDDMRELKKLLDDASKEAVG